MLMRYCRYLKAILDMAKQSPDLIFSLKLQNCFPILGPLAEPTFSAVEILTQPQLTSEVGTQSDVHPEINTRAQHGYEWNEWEMRRRTLMHVNLRNKATHSSQTNDSHFKRDSSTQSYLPKYNFLSDSLMIKQC